MRYRSLIFIKVIIFNDTQNFNGSLNFINKRFGRSEKRFWNYKKYIPFLLEKIKSIDNLSGESFELIKTYFYEGKYSSKMLRNLKWSCNQKIRELNIMIQKEKKLLDFISQEKLSNRSRKEINSHVNEIKRELEEKKEKYVSYLLKQSNQFEGQQSFFESLEDKPFIEIKYTPLKQNNGEVHQKGVDVLLAVDLVHLAHIDAYDVAIILSGDTDLIEAVRLIKSLGKTPIIFSYHTPKKPKLSNISDLMNAGKFINLKDLSDEEVFKMSDLRES